MRKTVLAVSFAKATGWAIRLGSGVITSSGADVIRPGDLGRRLAFGPRPDVVYMVDQGRRLVTQRTEKSRIYGELVAAATKWCEYNEVALEAVPTGTVKRYAAGNRAARMADVIARAKAIWPNVSSEHEAIALTLLDWVVTCRWDCQPTPAAKADAMLEERQDAN